MRFGSVCSGVEAASLAWEPLGFAPAFFAEIEKFPSAVLAHHWPTVQNLGDLTRIDGAAWRDRIDVLVGGTPCQAFSVAGLRRSLDDARGNITLAFVELVHAIDPWAVVWENVPGVLSTDDNAFGCFIAGLVGSDAPLVPPAGLRWTDAGMVAGPARAAAWRSLDAQYFELPQRRERVFVVSFRTRDGLNPGAVLFEPEGLRRDSPPSREAGEGVARPVAAGSPRGSGYRNDADTPDNLITGALTARFGNQAMGAPEVDAGLYIPALAFHNRQDPDVSGDVTHPLGAKDNGLGIAYALRSDAARTGEAKTPSPDAEGHVRLRDPGFNVLESLAPTVDAGAPHTVAFSCKDHGADAGDLAPTLRAMGHDGSHANAGGQLAVAWAIGSHAGAADGDVSNRSHESGGPVGSNISEGVAYALRGGRTQSVASSMAVRRLLPVECERLQGMPDGHTLIPWRGALAPDGPRYRAIGNSMAVPCMAWIGARLKLVRAAWVAA